MGTHYVAPVEIPETERLILRSQARVWGMTYFFTGVPCKFGHVARRSVKGGACHDCVNIRQRLKRVKSRDAPPDLCP